MSQSNRVLGEAMIPRLLFKFSVPCVMGLLISALYNIVDQIFIGNSELGYLGNAAPIADLVALMVMPVNIQPMVEC